MFEFVISELSALPEIEAIALGGSHSSKYFDENSDYDTYLYSSTHVSKKTQRDSP